MPFQFSFENCKFHIEKAKEGTGRLVALSMGIQNSYTIEVSMGGSKLGSRCGTHFSIHDYEQIGKTFCETLLDLFDQDPVKVKLTVNVCSITKPDSLDRKLAQIFFTRSNGSISR